MVERSDSGEDLEKLRTEVCSRCAGHRVRETWDGLPDTPCGCELPAAQLVAALRQHPEARAAVSLCGIDVKDAGCEPAPPCPCPLDRLADLAVEAAGALEQQHLAGRRSLECWEESLADDED